MSDEQGRGWYYGRRDASFDGPVYTESRTAAGTDLLGRDVVGPFGSRELALDDAEAWCDGLTTVEIEVKR